MTFLCLLLACLTPDDTGPQDSDTQPAGAPEWVAVGEGLGPALLCVTGTAADDVWVVGADAGSGGTILHYDGAAWTPIGGVGTGDVWWVSLVDAEPWFAGAGGRIFRWDGGALETHTVDDTVTLYGIWGATADDVWAVGGNPDLGSDAARAFHYDGSTWAEVALPAAAAAQTALFKVWGRSASEVYFVGAAGTILRWDGAALVEEETESTAALFTVHGNRTRTWVVGGTNAAEVLERASSGWTIQSPSFAYQLSGVYVPEDDAGMPMAAGAQGDIYFFDGSAWTKDERAKATYQGIHAVWQDPDGGQWAVGGHVQSLPLIQGVLVHAGDRSIPALEGL